MMRENDLELGDMVIVNGYVGVFEVTKLVGRTVEATYTHGTVSVDRDNVVKVNKTRGD